ncbi:dynamin family protein, partial [Leptospira santarosai]|nr:dynamin family protein [Leptospira santarosai]
MKGRLDSNDYRVLKDQVENQKFVVTVVGAMKSGKSTFTNALLGYDLMPNENQACTLTSTDVIHRQHNNMIK